MGVQCLQQQPGPGSLLRFGENNTIFKNGCEMIPGITFISLNHEGIICERVLPLYPTTATITTNTL